MTNDVKTIHKQSTTLTYSAGRAFLSAVINFFAISLALFMTGRLYGWAANDAIIKHQVKCKYCRKRISEKVSLIANPISDYKL